MCRPSSCHFLAAVFVSLTVMPAGVHEVRAQATDREQILQSAEWRQTMRDLDEWSSVQKIYDKDQLAQLQQELKKTIAEMPAEQLSDLLGDLQRKVMVLNSNEARHARKWLDQTLAVATPAYAAKIRAELPDVARLTAAQLQEQLDRWEDQQAARRRSAAEFAELREQQAEQVREDRIRWETERANFAAGQPSFARNNFSFTNTRRVYRPGFQQQAFRYPLLYGGFRW